MAYGLRVIGSHGYAQIDERYRNLHLIRKFSVTLPAAVSKPQGMDMGFYIFERSTSTCVVAVERLEAFNASAAISINSVDTTSRTRQCVVGNISTQTVNVNIYEFDTVSLSGGGFGLIVRNANNDIVFNSNYKPMRVVGFARNTVDIPLEQTIPISNRRYAVVQPESFYGVMAVYTNRFALYGAHTQEISGANYIFRSALCSEVATGAPNIGGNYSTYNSDTKSLLILDVTNY